MTNNLDITQESRSRARRLDALPFTPAHRRLLTASGIGWALDAMDVGLISYVMAALAVQWQLSSGQLSLLGSIGFVGMALGASLGGLLADRIGRTRVFTLTLLVYGIANGLMAAAGGLAVLLVLRFVVGLGLGAELPVASTLVSEFAPTRWRGRMVVALEAFWALGWITAAVIGYTLIPGSANGWRWALLVGAVPVVYAVVARRLLPESVRYLESRGRYVEAEASVRVFEQSAGVAPVPSPDTVPAAPARWRDLFAAGLARRTIALWLTWFFVNFSYYGAFLWLPTLLVQSGYPLVKSFEYTLIIALAQLPGYAVAAWLIEKWGRRPTLATFLIGSALAAGLFATASSPATIIGFGMMLSFFNLGAWGALYAISPEVYPTRLRGTGTGAAAGFGRIASIIAPLLVPVLVSAAGGETWLVFAVFTVAFLAAAAACLALPELRGRALTA